MGGQTIRMLQYLLETEFYIDNKKQIKEDSQLLGQSHKGGFQVLLHWRHLMMVLH